MAKRINGSTAMRNRRIAAGCCVRCGVAVEAERRGKTQCGPCAKANTDYLMARRAARIKAGRCCSCLRRKAAAGRIDCRVCAERSRINSQRHQAKPGTKKRAAKRAKERAAERRKAGICRECGQRPIRAAGCGQCQVCRDKSLERQRARRRRLARAKTCIVCGKRPATERDHQRRRKLTCGDCLARLRAARAAARKAKGKSRSRPGHRRG